MKKSSSKGGFLGGKMRGATGGDYKGTPKKPSYSGEDGKGGHPSTAKGPTKSELIK